MMIKSNPWDMWSKGKQQQRHQCQHLLCTYFSVKKKGNESSKDPYESKGMLFGILKSRCCSGGGGLGDVADSKAYACPMLPHTHVVLMLCFLFSSSFFSITFSRLFPKMFFLLIFLLTLPTLSLAGYNLRNMLLLSNHVRPIFSFFCCRFSAKLYFGFFLHTH